MRGLTGLWGVFAVCFALGLQACHCLRISNSSWTSVNGIRVISQASCDLGNLSWARFIDGKDAHRGHDAYGSNYTEHMERTMRLVLDDQENNSEKELSVDDLEDIHQCGCSKRDSAGHLMKYTHLRAPSHPVMLELPRCFQQLRNSTLKQNIAKDLPRGGREGEADVVQVHYETSTRKVSYLETRNYESQRAVTDQLRLLLERYNDNLRNAKAMEDDHIIHELALFLRSWAWLHPWGDCNGRTRALVLQRELRRFHLGCGALMFNNNADIYFETTDTLASKIREGIEMYEIALESTIVDNPTAIASNPWTDDTRVRDHAMKFPSLTDLDGECKDEFAKKHKDFTLM